MSRIRANQITNQSADGAPTVQNGLVITGVTTSTTFSGSGASLTNIPSAQLTGALPALDGSNLTGLSGVSIANQSNNRLITATGTTDALNGEAQLTFDGNKLITQQTNSDIGLLVQNTTHDSQLRIEAVAANKNSVIMFADGSDGDVGMIDYDHNDNSLSFTVNTLERLRITSGGQIGINQTDIDADLHIATAGSSEQDGTLKIGGSENSLGLSLTYDQAGATVSKITANPTYNNNSSLLKICVDGDGNPDQLVLNGNGKIGINIADNTAADLQVRTGTNGAGVFRLGGASSNGVGMDMTYSNSGATSTIFKQNYHSTHAGALMQFDSGYFTFRTGTSPSESMKINSNGHITKPNQPMCSYDLSSSIQSGNYIIHNTVHTNNGSHYNTGNGRFVCPVAGYYYASIMAMTNNSSTQLDIELHKNGSNPNNILVPYNQSGGVYNQVAGSCIIYCAANDYLQFKLNSGSVYNGRHGNASFALLA